MNVESFELLVRVEKSARRFFRRLCQKMAIISAYGVVAERPIGSGEDGSALASAGMSLGTSPADGLDS